MQEDYDRKNSHLAICLNEQVEYGSGDANGFGSYRFDHDALPEVDKSKISLSTVLFGKKLAAPLIVGAMTGGTEKAAEINRRLALAAEKCQVGFALGSQRKMLQDSGTKSSYQVRNHAPKLPLLVGNLGAVQLNYGVGLAELKILIDEVGCDAFNFHLNPLQEAIQPEGDTNFSGLIVKMKAVIPQMGVPVILKEVGSGISETTALKMGELPIAGIETAGIGGTSWSKIESLRTQDLVQRSTGELFARWGVPTAESVVTCRQAFPQMTIIASGGMRNGIEVAKAIGLGADAAALALPILKAAERSVDEAVRAISQVIEELRTAMFVTGSASVADLRKKKLRRTLDYTTIGQSR
ncbi:MAG: type 2 isopentenyl-diphosphate Delta-isomerase [Bdellovibrionota bacterium]